MLHITILWMALPDWEGWTQADPPSWYLAHLYGNRCARPLRGRAVRQGRWSSY